MRILVLLFAVFTCCQSAERLIVALKPDKNPEAMAAERAELGTYLSARLTRPVDVIVPLSGATILEGFAGGTVDLAYVSGTDLATAGKNADLLLVGRIAGRTTYDSIWVARKESNYRTVEDLRGKPVAFASRTSTSGFLIPRLDLVRRGLLTADKPDPTLFFGAGNALFGTGYVSAIERVLDGTAEAAAVSDYVMLGDKHLTPEQKAKLRIVQTQGPVPTHSLAARASLPQAERDALRDALEGLNEEAHRALRDRLFVAELVRADAAEHLAVVRDALALNQ